MFHNLPQDIINHILSYNDTIKYRNGKYMGQICNEDYRYEILRKIPRKTRETFYSGNFDVYRVNYSNNKQTLVVYIFQDSIAYLYINIENGVDSYFSLR